MMQRVALARALANDPEILLMDEPFGALDSQTRGLMQELLLRIWENSHKTVLFITHDIDEAIFLGDRVHVMTARPGQIKETVDIDIPRPRSVEVLTSPRFMDLKRQIMGLVHEEAIRAIR
jgi:ABC-type nitrate/sulfonate/bicarbonate transport system ATPase subunit